MAASTPKSNETVQDKAKHYPPLNDAEKDEYAKMFTHDLRQYCKEHVTAAATATAKGDSTTKDNKWSGNHESVCEARKKSVVEKIRQFLLHQDGYSNNGDKKCGDGDGTHSDNSDDNSDYSDPEDTEKSKTKTTARRHLPFKVKTPSVSTTSELPFDSAVLSRVLPLPLIRCKSFPFIECEYDSWYLNWNSAAYHRFMAKENGIYTKYGSDDESDDDDSSSSGSSTATNYSMSVLERFVNPAFEFGDKGIECRTKLTELCRTSSLPDLRPYSFPIDLDETDNEEQDDLELDDFSSAGASDCDDDEEEKVEQQLVEDEVKRTTK